MKFNEILKEIIRPWKIFTYIIGLGLLIIGSYIIPAPDWDVKISIIMSFFTYLFSGYTLHIFYEKRYKLYPLALFLIWWCIDGCYAIYWSMTNPWALEMMRMANFFASLWLYIVCGIIWYHNGNLKSLYKNFLSNFKII